MLVIRKEIPGDEAAVRRVNDEAFGRKEEGEIFDKLRKRGALTISLVADEDGRLVGYIAFSPVTVESENSSFEATCLAPVAVLPAYQNKGIGSQLVKAGLEECCRLERDVVVLLGHPTYYPRFGFVPAKTKGLECEYEAPDEAWMVIELRDGALAGRQGKVRFQPEFGEAV